MFVFLGDVILHFNFFVLSYNIWGSNVPAPSTEDSPALRFIVTNTHLDVCCLCALLFVSWLFVLLQVTSILSI